METYNQTAFPPIGIYDHDSLILKNANDAYDVFVNGESIGKKLVVGENDELDGIVDFLKVQGVKDISTNINGDHYNIQTVDADRVKAVISAYGKNR